jgi:hypothetical protein
MMDDPNFADYAPPDPPDRRLRDDEIDVDFIEAVLAVGAEFKLRGQGHTPPAAPAKHLCREIPASKVKALAERLRKETT